jgi:CotH kinase protein/Lamin Tail Domain/Chitobiase/beta-hexosaminidase C-terminal domain
MKLKTLLFVFGILFFSSVNAQVVINEYSASNLKQFLDNYGEGEDWIELYNTSAAAANIGGYYLSDDSLVPLKYQLPAGTSIAANGFLRIWASGRDLVASGNIHAGFKLTQTKKGERILFSNASGVRIDSAKLSKETKNTHSIGRKPNGSSNWGIFTLPTPGATNNASVFYNDYANTPTASIAPGFYTSTQTISFSSTDPNAVIRYTTNGYEPTAASPIYTTPITVASTKVVKAINFTTAANTLPSFTDFNTYFINEVHTLPVVSVSGSNLDLLAGGDGAQRPFGSFEYFGFTKIRSAKTYGEFNRHGQDSWPLSQRSMDFISRDECGYNSVIKEKLFELSNRNKFQRVILRASGDDNYPADFQPSNAGSAHVRDAYVQNLALRGKLNVDVRTATKTIVYMNGQYWGVYDIRELPDDHDYTDHYYGQGKYDLQYLLTWGNTWAEYGGTPAITQWNNFANFILNNNMTVAANYQKVTDSLDIKSLVDYVLVNSFTVCSDWINYNTGWWRGMNPAGGHKKWGYILWDNDATFGFYINYTGIPNTTAAAAPCDAQTITSPSVDVNKHIRILNKLRTNPTFNQYYITRQIDLWNTVFSCNNMLPYLDTIKNTIGPEMTRHTAKWGGTYAGWLANLNTLKTFITQRCVNLSTGIKNCYSLLGPYNLTVNADSASSGMVNFNTLALTQFPYKGKYFGGVNNILQAVPDSNHQFNNWTSTSSQTFTPNANATLVNVNLSVADSIVAHFAFSTVLVKKLEKNENYFKAYPNIVKDETFVEYALEKNKNASIVLYNINGVKVLEINPKVAIENGIYKTSINFSQAGVAPGVYTLNLRTESINKSVKLIYQPQ